MPSADTKDLFSFLDEYHKLNAPSQKSDEKESPEEGNEQGSASKSKNESKSFNEEIIDEKIEAEPDNFLSSMSRDGLRGPYGMTTSFNEETNLKYRLNHQ